MNKLSLNTQAILLLTAPLQIGKLNQTVKVLTPSEYRKLASHLLKIKQQPADFLAQGNYALLNDCADIIEKERLSALLERGFLLSQALEYWSARSIWVLSRADTDYPKIYKQRLGEYTPALLYGCGDKRLLNTIGLAVVGSRETTDDILDQTKLVGALAAQSGITIVSGGAKGIDQAAMNGALEVGGRACGVLASNLEQAALSRDNNQWLRNKQLVLVSAFDPKARFTVWQAMERNKYIYALAQAALVMNSDKDKGGTWEGAKEQLEKHRFLSVYVRSTGEKSAGLEAIQAMGGQPWPNPTNKEELEKALNKEPFKLSSTDENLSLFDDVESSLNTLPCASVEQIEHSIEAAVVEPPVKVKVQNSKDPKDILFNAAMQAITIVLQEPRSAEEIATILNINKSQVNEWLNQLIVDQIVQKLSRPARYQLAK